VGGLEHVVVRLVEHLAPRLDQAVVSPSGSGPLAERFPETVSVAALGDRRRSGKWNALVMARLFRTLHPDIVHTRNWTCIDAVIGSRLAGVPVVIHGEHGREAVDPDGRNLTRRRIRRLLAPLVTHFVAVSRDLARWLVEDVGVPARKVRTIRNGVDVGRFCPGDREGARRALGLPVDAAVIGTVGRLDPVKDHAGLIRALALGGGGERGVLVIAGDGPCRKDLEALARSLGLEGRVRILGDRDDVPRVLQVLDVFVLSSVGEGMSNAILEAMATGLPVVATRVGGNPELVLDGVTGRLVPPRSPAALADAVGTYLDHPERARAHGAAGRTRTVAEFGLDQMLTAYTDLYRTCLPAEASP
jgi:sugar transferase (PEP-CTERM/EpsH1 system associated)